MNIKKIYHMYRIPENLQQHMQWVAQVAEEVVENWIGSGIDPELIQQTALLHDMANIIKFKRPFWGAMAKNIYYWEQIQEEFIAQYGYDVHRATLKIVGELGLSDSVGKVLSDMEKLKTNPEAEISYEARIVEYADCRVGFNGIISFEDRINDLEKRYHHSLDDTQVVAMRLNRDQVLKYAKIKD